MKRLPYFAIFAFFIISSIAGYSTAQEKNADVSGKWAITIQFIHGAGTHTAIIKQKGSELSGAYKGEFEEGTLRGTINGDTIDFTGFLKHEASSSIFHYTGAVQGSSMEGTVDLGEYWTAKWTAKRVK